MLLFIIYFLFLGLIVGSFLNVVILRYNTGYSLSGRSGCFSCGHGLAWYEMIPVASYLVLCGRCKHCHSRISRQYPLVEIFTGLLFALTAWRFYPNMSAVLFYCLILSLLVVVVVYDLKHKIIVDTPVYAFILLSVMSPAILNWKNALSTEVGFQIFLNLVSGAVIFLAFFSLWYFSRGRWMGFGDAKLGFGIGALLGFSGSVNAVVLAFWFGALVGLSLIGLGKIKSLKSFRRKFSIKSEIPFAPFLVLGLLLSLFANISILVF